MTVFPPVGRTGADPCPRHSRAAGAGNTEGPALQALPWEDGGAV